MIGRHRVQNIVKSVCCLLHLILICAQQKCICMHEVVGEVIELGSQVKAFQLGDIIGGIVGSCGECTLCTSNLEQYCNHRILPYNDIYSDGTLSRWVRISYGNSSKVCSQNSRGTSTRTGTDIEDCLHTWIQVHQKFGLMEEILFLTVTLLDRYLSLEK